MTTRPFTIRLGVKDAATVRNALRSVGDDGEKALKKLERAAASNERQNKKLRGAALGATSGFRSLAQSAALVQGPLGSVAGRITTLNVALGAANPAIAAAVVGLAGLAIGIGKTVSAGSALEKSMFTVTKLLETTGGASGKTAAQIDALAVSIGRSTLASVGGVRQAAAALLTFRNVSGAAFDRTLRLAQDMSAVLGTDLRAAVLQLGKALEDPERNLSQLNRSGISFSQGQIDVIKALKETGQEAEALNKILEAIEGQLGGAGDAQGQGLSGAFDELKENVGLFFESLSKNTGVMNFFADSLRGFAAAVEATRRAVAPSPAESINQALAENQERLDALQARRTEFAGVRGPGALMAQGVSAEIQAALAEREKLIAQLGRLAAAEGEASRAAEAGAEAHREAARAAKAEADANEELDKVLKGVWKTLDKQEAAQAKAQESIAGLIDGIAAETINLQLNARERAIRINLLKAEKIALAAGIQLTQEQVDAIVRETEALQDAKEAVEARAKAEREARRVQERESKARQRQVEQEAAAFRRPFENAFDAIQRSFADMLDDMLSGTTDSFEDMAKSAQRIWTRMLSEFATAQAVSRFNGVQRLSGGGSAARQTGASIASNAGSGAAASGGAAGSGAGAAAGWIGLAATALKQVELANQDNWIGDALLGILLPSIEQMQQNPSLAIAPAIGLPFLNSFGVFGPSASVGPNGGATLGVRDGRVVVTGSGGDNGFDPGPFVKSAQDIADQLNAVADALGGDFAATFRDFGTAAQATFGSFASRGGLLSIVGPSLDAEGGFSSTFGDDAQAAALDLVLRFLKSVEIEGAPAEIATALANTKARTIGDLASDIQFAASIADFDLNADKITQAEQALNAINDQFDEMTKRGQALGLSIDVLVDARARELADLTEGFDESIRLQILAITDPTAQAFEALASAQETRLAEAEAAGADLVEVERLNMLERKRLVEQTAGDINALLTELTIGTLSGASPQARLDAARSAFNSASALAGSGAAVPDLAATVRTFVEASRSVNATGGTYGADLAAAVALLESAGGGGFAHGGIADRPSIFGEGGAEAAIPLDSARRIPIAEVRFSGGLERATREQVGLTTALLEEVSALRRETGALRAIIGRQQASLSRLVHGTAA